MEFTLLLIWLLIPNLENKSSYNYKNNLLNFNFLKLALDITGMELFGNSIAFDENSEVLSYFARFCEEGEALTNDWSCIVCSCFAFHSEIWRKPNKNNYLYFF